MGESSPQWQTELRCVFASICEQRGGCRNGPCWQCICRQMQMLAYQSRLRLTNPYRRPRRRRLLVRRLGPGAALVRRLGPQLQSLVVG